jgi:hypothetical protein
MICLCYIVEGWSPCALDLLGVNAHYDLHTREWGDISRNAHRGGPRSNWNFTYSNVFSKHAHFEEVQVAPPF